MAVSPTSINSANIPANDGAVKFYARGAIKNFKAETPAIWTFKEDFLPVNSGTQMQFYTYNVLGANTTQVGEGVVGSPIGESTTPISCQLGQYADYVNASDFSLQTAIDSPDLMTNLGVELNYRGALTLNQLALNTLDSTASIDSTVNGTLGAGNFLTASNLRSAIAGLEAINVRPFAGNKWRGLISPLVCRDVLNDQSANGLTDILKRTDAGNATLLGSQSETDFIEYCGIQFKKTSTVPTTTISSNTYYVTYIVGDDAVYSVSLGKTPGGSMNLQPKIAFAKPGGSGYDPAGVIGGWAAY